MFRQFIILGICVSAMLTSIKTSATWTQKTFFDAPLYVSLDEDNNVGLFVDLVSHGGTSYFLKADAVRGKPSPGVSDEIQKVCVLDQKSLDKFTREFNLKVELSPDVIEALALPDDVLLTISGKFVYDEATQSRKVSYQTHFAQNSTILKTIERQNQGLPFWFDTTQFADPSFRCVQTK